MTITKQGKPFPKKPLSERITVAHIGTVLMVMCAFVYAVCIYNCGERAGKETARAEISMDAACSRNHRLYGPSLWTEANQRAYTCTPTNVAICLVVDGETVRCDSVDCDMGSRCR